MNGILLQLREQLEIDLWTLDYLWWHLDQLETGPSGGAEVDDIEQVLLPEEEQDRQRFGLESHLQEFLRDNWHKTDLGRDWALYQVPGDEEAGYEYHTSVGNIDLLAKHRRQAHWLVVELKRGRSGDQTVGQLLRYMGWVKRNLAEQGDEVHGMVICHEADDNLRYALSVAQNVELRLYEVEFHLKSPETMPGHNSRRDS